MLRTLRERRGTSAPARMGAWAPVILVIAGLSACSHRPRGTSPPQAWHYAITGDLDRWEVELCFTGPRPDSLIAGEEAGELLRDPRDLSTGAALPSERGGAPRIDLRGLAGPCLAYAVDLGGGSDGWGRALRRVGDDLVVANELWLWRPPKVPAAPVMTVAFDLGDATISSPWPPTSAATTFAIPEVGLRWRSYTAVGGLDVDRITVAGGELEVVLLDAPHRLSRGGARRWLESAAGAVAALYGAFPVDHLQVLLVPVARADSPVLFGAVERGGPTVLLVIDGAAEDEDFIGEWVSIHELLHIGMPYIDREDAWLPEGFVTYYTEVVRARTGLRSEEEAWSALLEGLGRGLDDVRGDRSLRDASLAMHDLRAYSWVYWGGAAIALLADVAVRRESDGSLALDDGLRHLWRCCARSDRRWSAAEILAELDRWRGQAWIVPLAERILATSGFVDLPALYRKLGVSMVNGSLALDGAAALTDLRRAIFARPRQASIQ